MESIQVAKISASSIVVYNKQLEPPPRSSRQVENEKNLRNQEYNGYMSPKTRCKVRKMLDAWITAVELKRQELGQGKYFRNSKITFVTLTLSSKQAHDDNYIKRNMLNRFLIELRREKGVNHYFWRAEPQENGNIHFHILVDRFIHWRFIRDKWNSIQGDHGYLTEFYSKFLHLDPNSTDIHGLEKINNLAAYVVKYCCKVKNGRTIQGRIWGCSDTLRNLTCFESEMTNEVRNYIEAVEKDSKTKVVTKEEFTLIFCDNRELLKKLSPHLYRKFYAHYNETFDDLYTENGRERIRLKMLTEKMRPTCRADRRGYGSVERARPLGSFQLELFSPGDCVSTRWMK